MMQVQPGEHFAEELFSFSFEMVPLKNSLRCAAALAFAGDEGVLPEHFIGFAAAREGKEHWLGHAFRLVFDPGKLFVHDLAVFPGLFHQGTPLAGRQGLRRTFQRSGPFVIAYTPLPGFGANALQIFARGRSAIGLKIG